MKCKMSRFIETDEKASTTRVKKAGNENLQMDIIIAGKRIFSPFNPVVKKLLSFKKIICMKYLTKKCELKFHQIITTCMIV